MLIESDDVLECISKIFKEINESDKKYSQFKEITDILFRIIDDISDIEAEQAGKNVQYKYNKALYGLKDK